MEQQILTNTETIINNFNELLIKTINNEKDKLIEDFKAQIKSDVVQKLNGNTNELFIDKNITFDVIKKTIYNDIIKWNNNGNGESAKSHIINNVIPKIDNDIIFRLDEYIINWKYQILHYNTMGMDKNLFVFVFTNYGSIIIRYTKFYKIYVGKYKLTDEFIYIFNEMINSILSYDKTNNSTPENIYITNTAMYANQANQVYEYNIRGINNLITIIEKLQTDYFAKPLIS